MAESRGEVKLTPTKLQALKPAPKGTRYELKDKLTPNLLIRVTAAGTKSFVLKARFGNSRNPVRRTLGVYSPDALPNATAGCITLETARKKAREWMASVKGGHDPALAEAARTGGLFAAVAESYIAKVIVGPNPANWRQRQGRQAVRHIRNVLIPAWGTKHIVEVRRADVVALIKKNSDVPGQCRNVFATARALFRWARDTEEFGFEVSPCEGVSVVAHLGEKPTRERTLTDTEIKALWKCSKFLGFEGAIWRLLLLTGLRKYEAAGAKWDEFDLVNYRWTIPASRMKGKHGKAKPHLVPLTDDILAILESLKRHDDGPYVFSNTNGKARACFEWHCKLRLDKRMKRMLRDKFQPWQTHDIRRTVRTKLSSLRVPFEVAEMVLAHSKTGVVRNYDLHQYEVEKAEALAAWAAHLKGIVETRRNNVVPLRGVA
jgi:integrase